MNRRQRRAEQFENERLVRWASSPDGKAKLERYAKTYAYCIRFSRKEVEEMQRTKEMLNYPTKAKNTKEAIDHMDSGEYLWTSSVSNTDLYAMEEALRTIDAQKAKELVHKTSTKKKTLWEKIKYFFYKITRKTN